MAFALPARAGDDEIVAEFKKYFRQYKDAATRVEAVLSLESADSPAVVGALVPVLKMVEEPDVVRAAIRVLGKFKNDAAKQALFVEIETNKDEAVRVGLLQAVTAGRYGGANEALKKLLTEKAWDIRRRAIEALVATKDVTLAESIVPLCSDAEPAVRCAALEGLAALKSTLVLPPAIASLGHEVWQVRASAITALKSVRSTESIPPLIERLAVEEGRLCADIGDALNEITGRSYGVRVEHWRQFWDNVKERGYKIPTDGELAKLRAKQKEEAAKYKPEKPGRPTTASRRLAGASCSSSTPRARWRTW